MRSLFVLGSGRSGASVVAGILDRHGLFRSAELCGPSAASPYGVFESPAVVAVNEALLAAVVPGEELLFENQRWLARLPEDVEVPSSPELDGAIRELVRRTSCFKDPRFVWTLPVWRRQAGDAKMVCVFRSPEATAASMVEFCQGTRHLAQARIDRERAFEIWVAVHGRILRQLRREGEWLFLHLDQTFSGEGLDRLAAFAGGPVNRDFPVPELRRAPPARAARAAAPAAARELYAELCELAQHRPDPRRVHRTTAAAETAPAEIAVVVPVLDADRPRVGALLLELAAQRGVRFEIVLVDQTTAGGLEAEGAHIVREPSPCRARAYRRALETTDAAWIAWQDPAVSPLPHRLARQARYLRRHPEVDLLTSGLVLRQADGSHGSPVAVDLSRDTPPAFWQSGVLVRRAALAGLGPTCFAPTELALYRALRTAGRTAHLAEALASVDGERFETRAPLARQDAELLDLAETPAEGEPQLTVLLACHERKDALMECLEGFSRQLLPPGTFELIVIDDGSTDGTAELARDLQLPVPYRFLEQEQAGAGAARNRGLPHVRGALVLFVNDDTIPFPDTVQRHLEAHRELADEQAVVLGTFEQPPEECAKNLTRLLERTSYVFAYIEFERERELEGKYFYTCNASLSTEAVRRVGGFDESFACYGEDTDYGVRLEELGYRLHFRPEARSIHRHACQFEGMRWRQRTVAQANARLFGKHPRILHEQHATLTAPWLTETLGRARDQVPALLAAARTLSAVDLASLERLGGSHARTAARLEQHFGELFGRLNNYWWSEGFVDNFRELGVSGFPEMLAARPIELEGLGPFVLLTADAGDLPMWPAAAEAWFAGGCAHGTALDGATLAVWPGPEGPPVAVVRRALAGIVARAGRRARPAAAVPAPCPADPRPADPAAAVAAAPAAAVIVEADLRGVHRVRLFAAAQGWLPSGSAGDAEDRELATLATTPELELGAGSTGGPSPPWRLTTPAAWRLLAWPRWDSPQALRALALALTPLIGRDDICVVLRHEPERDGDLELGLTALRSASRDLHGDAAGLEVLLETSPEERDFWPRMAQALDAVLCLGADSSPHAARLAELDLPMLRGSEELARWLAEQAPRATFDISVHSTREPAHA
ncbi:MAG: glycosyltransferase [Planctomycetota bacterium]|nr:MAG: glycosyltransferase [Planctomycetota bacterium]